MYVLIVNVQYFYFNQQERLGTKSLLFMSLQQQVQKLLAPAGSAGWGTVSTFQLLKFRGNKMSARNRNGNLTAVVHHCTAALQLNNVVYLNQS